MNPDFWQERRVFVTGHTGFKGAWLSLWLGRLGARVTGFARIPQSEPSLFVDAAVGDGMSSVIGELADLAGLQAAMAAAEPTVVFHLAAQSLVRAGYADPVETFASNVLGTTHLLEAVRHTPSVAAVVVVTTDKCYENNEWHWGYRETDRLGGHDPYAASKACAELVTAAYRDSFLAQREPRPVAVATARAGNVIGGGDWAADRLVPDLVRGVIDGRPTRIRCPGAIRPWQHVLEPLAGYARLAESLIETPGRFAGAWNFGPAAADAREVGAVADRLVELWGEDAAWQLDELVHPPEATYLKLDSSKARAELGFRPRLDLDAALSWTVDWYRGFGHGKSARTLCEDQIDRYQGLGAQGLGAQGLGAQGLGVPS